MVACSILRPDFSFCNFVVKFAFWICVVTALCEFVYFVTWTLVPSRDMYCDETFVPITK